MICSSRCIVFFYLIIIIISYFIKNLFKLEFYFDNIKINKMLLIVKNREKKYIDIERMN